MRSITVTILLFQSLWGTNWEKGAKRLRKVVLSFSIWPSHQIPNSVGHQLPWLCQVISHPQSELGQECLEDNFVKYVNY